MNARCGLPGDDGPSAGASGYFEELAIAIEKAGGGVEDVEQGGIAGCQGKRRQDAERHLLVTAAQARAGWCREQFQANAADPPGTVG